MSFRRIPRVPSRGTPCRWIVAHRGEVLEAIRSGKVRPERCVQVGGIDLRPGLPQAPHLGAKFACAGDEWSCLVRRQGLALVDQEIKLCWKLRRRM